MASIDNEKLDILNMIHDKVAIITDGYFYCVDGDKASVVNSYGTEVLSGDKDSIMQVGRYICMIEPTNKIITANVNIYSFKTNRKKSIEIEKSTGIINKDLYKAKLIALDKYITVKVDYSNIIILNEDLAIIGEVPECKELKVGKTNETSLYFNYYSYPVWMTGLIDKRSDKLVHYGVTEVSEGLELAATEYFKSGFSINRNTFDYFKYKPVKNGIICGDKTYQDIVKVVNNRSDMLYTYELGRYNNKCVGMITDENVEVFPAIYKSIEYIGANNYKLVYEGNMLEDMAFIYNIETGSRSADYRSSDIIIHQTLPLTIVKKRGQTVILDSKGRLFDIKDIAKYFKCSYSLDNNTVLKFEFEYGSKYVDNRLTPITNLHAIASLSKNKWVRL